MVESQEGRDEESLGDGIRDVISCDGVKVETQMEPRRYGARVQTSQVWRAKVELIAHGAKAEVGIRKTTVELERLRTTAEPEERWSLVEPQGWKAETYQEVRNTVLEHGDA